MIVGRLVNRLRMTRDVASFGLRPADRLRAALLVLASPALRRSRFTPSVGLSLRLDGRLIRWTAETDADLVVLHQVFNDEYDVSGVDDPRVIVDLGSHVGASVIYFAHRFFRARIIAVEPDPANFRKLRRHVGQLSNVELHNVAVTDESRADVTFFESGERDSWASSPHRSNAFQEPIQVAGRRLDDLLADSDIDAVDPLKIDIEGAEYEVLRSFVGLGKVKTIVGEVHPELMGCDLSEFLQLLDRFDTDLTEQAAAYQPFRAQRA